MRNIKTPKKLKKTYQIPKNEEHDECSLTQKTDHIWTNQDHKHVGNHARINNLAFIHFDYKTIITIRSKWVSVQN